MIMNPTIELCDKVAKSYRKKEARFMLFERLFQALVILSAVLIFINADIFAGMTLVLACVHALINPSSFARQMADYAREFELKLSNAIELDRMLNNAQTPEEKKTIVVDHVKREIYYNFEDFSVKPYIPQATPEMREQWNIPDKIKS